jgi:hypothetical protein
MTFLYVIFRPIKIPFDHFIKQFIFWRKKLSQLHQRFFFHWRLWSSLGRAEAFVFDALPMSIALELPGTVETLIVEYKNTL